MLDAYKKSFRWSEFGTALLSAHSCRKTERGRTQQVKESYKIILVIVTLNKML